MEKLCRLLTLPVWGATSATAFFAAEPITFQSTLPVWGATFLGIDDTLETGIGSRYGLKIGEIDGELCLRLDKSIGSDYLNLLDMFTIWQKEAAKL